MRRTLAGLALVSAAVITATLAALSAPGRPVLAQGACRNVAIRAPVTGESVTGTVPILGSAQIDGFNFYKVEWAPASQREAWRAISDVRGEPVINGLLDQWNTASLPDGAYRLKLTVVDQAAAEICRELVEDIVVGSAVAEGTPTATETATPTNTEALPPSATAAVVEATAAPAEPVGEVTPLPTGGEAGAADGAAATPTATPEESTTEEDDSGESADLDLDNLARAFIGGFCLALLLAGALVALQALRGES